MKEFLNPLQIDIVLKAMTVGMFMAIVRVIFSRNMKFADLLRLLIGSGLLGGGFASILYEIKWITPYYKIIAAVIGLSGDKVYCLIVENFFNAITKVIDGLPKIINEGVKDTIASVFKFFKPEKKEENESTANREP